jgi:hypothetical protein
MTHSYRSWLRALRNRPTRPVRRPGLRLTRLEDRWNPVSVANVLANTPEPSQGTLTVNYTQSETSTLSFGSTVVVS